MPKPESESSSGILYALWDIRDSLNKVYGSLNEIRGTLDEIRGELGNPVDLDRLLGTSDDSDDSFDQASVYDLLKEIRDHLRNSSS